ncbi:MAG TPA: PAS domain S-box protein [Chryseosolibacter sp.]
MPLIKAITEAGTAFTSSKAEKRNITLSNYISLVAASATLFLLLGRFVFAFVNLAVLSTLTLGIFLFIIPIILNRFGLIRVSRLALCWLPAIFQLYASVRTMGEAVAFESSTYVGLRFFMLAFSCFPFLVFDMKWNWLFITGLIGPLACLFLFDPLLNFVNLGYYQQGLSDPSYEFNNVRTFIACWIIGFSCYFLKSLIEQSDAVNEKLLYELEAKNQVIQKQAEHELHQLNEQLYANLQQLSEREFILSQSQRIAKVGSWQYRIKEKNMYWSDEMYNIFGLDKHFNINIPKISETLWGNQNVLMQDALKNVLTKGIPYDLTIQAKTPLGYNKWVRVYGFPVKEGPVIVGASGICHDITFYKEAEEQIRFNERKYRMLFEQASDAIVVTDFHGNISDVNSALCSIFGYSKTELLQKNINELLDEKDRLENAFATEAIAHGAHVFGERTMVTKDGRNIVVEANVKRSGEESIMGIIREVTELKEVQRQVQLSEARFRGAFEDSAIGMALVAPEGSWLKVNRAFCKMTGYSEEELLTMTFQQMIHADDAKLDLATMQRTLAGEPDVFQFQKRYIHKNGSTVWVHINVSVIRDKHTILYFVVQVEDITEDRLAREKLMLSEANLNATINNTEILIWSVDREFRLITFNRAFQQFVRETFKKELIPGVDPLENPATPEGLTLKTFWSNIYMRALAGEALTFEHSTGGRDFITSVSPIIEDTKVIGVSVFADNVTERKMKDRELVEAQAKIGELKLMALRSVMNPHFVFNVLNSIQYYITKNDRLNAINYLSMFSKLIRSILNHSVNNKIKLAEEIEMLKHYVNLEMTRFENKFNFVLTVAPDIDADSIEIPSLLVQPYVENAILHGLYNKKSEGTLRISVFERDEILTFEIEDDGVGREEARRLKSKNAPAHKSMGIKITEERLKLINESNNVALQIIDLNNGHGPAGTKVVIGVRV